MKYLFASCILITMAGTLNAQEEKPEILVQISRKKIYEGQSILYAVTLNHVENPSAPDLSGLDDFDVQLLGERSLDATSITIINGRMTKIIRRGREYQYRLTPRKTGRLTIPGPVAIVDGKQLVGPESTLEVVPADQQDIILMNIQTDRPTVYPMQPFTVTLNIHIKGLPSPLEKTSPIGVQESPPNLRIPWVMDDELPDGLEPEMDWQQWLRPIQSSAREGFNVNDIGKASISFFFEEQVSRFKTKATQKQLPDKDGNPTEYWHYAFERTFIAKKVGTYRFGPVTLQGTFGTKVNGRDQLVGEEIYAVAQPIPVTVQDVPHPPGDEAAFYTGAIGRFQWKSDLEPKQVRVGDPMTLTLTLTGDGTLQNVAAPDLKKIPEIADHFRIYEATEETNRTSCQFTYSLRPTDATIESFPGVPIVYFDIDKEEHITLTSDPIPVKVTKADRLSGDQVVSVPRDPSGKNGALKRRREGIFANVTDIREVRDESVHPVRWLAGLSGLLGLYILLAVVTVRVRRVVGDQAYLRRRGAPAKARRRMREALAELEQHHHRAGVDTLRDALCGLVADVANVPEVGLTSKDARLVLEKMGLDPDHTARFGNLLEQCDAAQYGAFDQNSGAFGKEAALLLEETIRQLKAQK